MRPFQISRRDALRRFVAGAGLTTALAAGPAFAPAALAQDRSVYSDNELVASGHHFFGSLSRGLAEAIQSVTKRWGQPNAYILGQEGGGAFIGGLRYGDGAMYTRNAGDRRIYWQGPSLGFDAGADGDRTMMLIYNLPSADSIYQRFGGIDGSAYLVGGFGVTALGANGVTVVPIRTGVGARLGINLGYLKFTRDSTWNPF
ncbi:hypothetical protein CCR94_08780 [Rhodoblastus sphagnicola]|uniref:DUF1134 domain-containing protein n=1 Tax=Rhodoblastus sphagnicola TaxID=333368 RepID=A0A2S6N9V1_9HYPH|nr:DUF1134 domain-containing protein [Rhodoblastus sphagnicola]MBB4198757.1 hypothetical protein [Rhodoblastus sphagnicola]PPQ31393.1 hypothetical protein CCR94_08780 [Rhodoblastus sphagnicola]